MSDSAGLSMMGEFPPEVPPVFPDTPTNTMTEEEWLRELARRMTTHARRFGGVDKQIRREMELASEQLRAYANIWERHNKKLREIEEKENGR